MNTFYKKNSQTLIIGLGNELLGDEGVGVHGVRSLRQEKLPENVEAIEVGTAILDALEYLESADRIIILDAMKGGSSPGTIYKVQLADCKEKTAIASMHGFDIFRVMALSQVSKVPPVTVFGVEPEKIDWSLELSPAVSESMPFLLQALREELS